MSYKVRIFQPLVPHYRVGLFKGIGRQLPGRVEICAPENQGEYNKSIPVDGVLCDFCHPERKVGPFYIMKRATLKGMQRGDVVVIEGNIRKLSFLRIALQAKLRGIGVVWWGLHRMPDQKKLPEVVRVWIMKHLASSILFYNQTGVDWFKARGEDISRVFAVGNAIDQQPIKTELEYWTPNRLSAFSRANGLSSARVLLACTRLSDKVRLHEAIRAMAEPDMPQDVILAVIGDGPLREELMKLAKDTGVEKKIRWLGAMFDQHDMAPWFLSAKLFVYPGPVGLGVLHAMAYGLPAVLNDTHNSTEAEAFENGKCGLMFKEFDVADLAKTIQTLLNDERNTNLMGEYAQRRVFKYYTMDNMVRNYCAAIVAAHKFSIEN